MSSVLLSRFQTILTTVVSDWSIEWPLKTRVYTVWKILNRSTEDYHHLQNTTHITYRTVLVSGSKNLYMNYEMIIIFPPTHTKYFSIDTLYIRNFPCFFFTLMAIVSCSCFREEKEQILEKDQHIFFISVRYLILKNLSWTSDFYFICIFLHLSFCNR